MILVGLASAVRLASAADITGSVTLSGTPPKEKEIQALKDDPTCGKLHPEAPTTHHFVVGPKGEFGNVTIFLEGISGKSTGASAEPVVMDQKGCEYTPQIFAVQTGQKILVKNSDPVAHNVHDTPTAASGNKEMNNLQMAGSPDMPFVFDKPEMFLRFKCDVHPWMFAWVSVFDHPYFAVTAKDGTYKIANVPAGKYKLVAAHRKVGATMKGEGAGSWFETVKDVEVKEGAPTQVDFTLEVK